MPVKFVYFVAFVIVICVEEAFHSQAGVQTLSVRQGSSRVFWTCIALLETAYLGAMAFGLSSQACSL